MESKTLQAFEEAIKQQKIWWFIDKKQVEQLERFAAKSCYDIHKVELDKVLNDFVHEVSVTKNIDLRKLDSNSKAQLIIDYLKDK